MKYSIEEIEQIRSLVESMKSAPRWLNGGGIVPNDEKQQIEEEVRTYMQAGITVTEVQNKHDQLYQELNRHRKARDEYIQNFLRRADEAHIHFQSKWENAERPPFIKSSKRACESCRFRSSAMAGKWWDRCYHPEASETWTDHGGGHLSVERTRCVDFRKILAPCGKSGKLHEPDEISRDEAEWFAAQLTPEAIRYLMESRLSNSYRCPKEATESLKRLSIWDRSPIRSAIYSAIESHNATPTPHETALEAEKGNETDS
jgi:hypothetical protein